YHAGRALLDHDALRPRRPPRCQRCRPLRLHQPGDCAARRRQFRNRAGATCTAGQLAADRRHRPLRDGAAPLRYAGWRRDSHRQGRCDARGHQRSLHMIRWLLWLLGGMLLGGIVHLATVLLLPRTATQDAYTRLSATAPAHSVVPLPAPTPDDAVLPFMDPAFATAVCRYDLGPLKLRVPVSQAYTSVSFYTRAGVAYYAINDRAAGRRTIELDLMTTAQ